ncbi:MAG: KH domain-containing protein [Patescibacteria group bacterium]
MSATIDQQFVEYIIKSIVSNPDDVSINRTVDEKGVLLELTVNDEDLGRVIGKRGATAQSVRTLLRALGTKNEARYNLKIIDNSPEGSRPPRQDDRNHPTRDEGSTSVDDTSTAPVTEDTSAPADDTQAEPATEKQVDLSELQDKEDEDTSSSISRTRKELEDLDDLDV